MSSAASEGFSGCPTQLLIHKISLQAIRKRLRAINESRAQKRKVCNLSSIPSISPVINVIVFSVY